MMADSSDSIVSLGELEQQENRDENQEFAEDDNPIGTRSTGSIFAWHNADQLASVGILYVVLALILVEGRVISDSAFAPPTYSTS